MTKLIRGTSEGCDTWDGPHLGPSELGYAPQNFEPSHIDRLNLMA